MDGVETERVLVNESSYSASKTKIAVGTKKPEEKEETKKNNNADDNSTEDTTEASTESSTETSANTTEADSSDKNVDEE